MYARSITIMGDPGRMDDGIAYVRDEVMPTITAMDGCVGLSMLVDRASGQCIVTSSWQSEETMRASDLHLAPIRRRGGEVMGGSPRVEEWEVAVMHRDHGAPEGSCCRVTWMRLNHGGFDRGIALYKSAMLPEMESLEGFCSASLLINRASGRAVSCGVFDSAEAMQRNREQSAALRVDAARQVGVEAIDVREFELALAHLRVPELV